MQSLASVRADGPARGLAAAGGASAQSLSMANRGDGLHRAYYYALVRRPFETTRQSRRRRTSGSWIYEDYHPAPASRQRASAGADSSVLSRRLIRVGLDHPVADEPGQRAVVERAQAKERSLALRAGLGAHHLMAASPKDDDAPR